MNELIKNMTVSLMNQLKVPKRPKSRKFKKRKEDSLAIRWFGLVPFSIKVTSKNFKKRSSKIRFSK